VKIAFISTMEGCPWGGSEVLWSLAAEHLSRNGAAVAACVRQWPETPKQIDTLTRAGCLVFTRRTKPLLLRAAAMLGIARNRDWSWLRSFQPNLALISLGVHLEGIEATSACRSARIPYALLIHTCDENRWPGDDYLDLLREAYLAARACYFTSQRSLELLETMLAVRFSHAKVVRNPFNVRYEAAPPWPSDTGEMRLACVGALAPVAKGQDLILSILALPEWRSRPVRLSLFGAGQNARSIAALVKMLGLEQVELRGYVDDIEQVWAEHHALILPSRHEGMPLAVVEAMLCGRVCVVTDVAGNSEFIDDGTTGFVAPAPTFRLVRQALDRAWARRLDWPRIGEAAAQAVRERVPADPVGAFVQELELCVKDTA
jgi:glycosyltransferase involved in cell wall biosynthesis